jgi:RNA polymerase sigma-70 factor (ECF subfamily)
MLGKASVSDETLIQGLQGRPAERQRCEYLLYRRHLEFVRLRPRKYALTDEEARDCYTEAFLAVIDHIRSGRFRGESSIKTYLSRIFRNKCVDQFRKNSTVSATWVDEFPDLPDESRDFLRALMSKEELTNLGAQIEALGERCQQLLLLSGQGYSPAEIATEMGFKTPRSASSQRYKCLEKLKARLGADSSSY